MINPDDKTKSWREFCGERSSEGLYKQKRKRNSIALQSLGENLDVAMENNVSEIREQNIVQRLSSKYISIPIAYTENIENKGKNLQSPQCGNFSSSTDDADR